MTTRENKRRPSGVDQVVGANIQRLRIAQSLTLAELAVRLGISHQQLHKYEHGSNRAAASMVYGLSRALVVPVISLFDRVESLDEFENAAAALATARKRCKDIVDATSCPLRLDAMSRILSVLQDQSSADPTTV